MKKLYNRINSDELKQRMLESKEPRTTLSFYQYAHITDPDDFRNQLYMIFENLGVFGRIYVAGEGINGQISLPTENLEKFRDKLYTFPFLKDIGLTSSKPAV